MATPFSPPAAYFARQAGGGVPVQPFSAPPPGGEDPGVLAGFLGSAISSIPELFGAPPTDFAEQFRTRHPIWGFGSELAGFSVPYLGAEKIATLPSVAPKLASGIESILGRVGMSTLENPIVAGVTRELIVNAPVEASRLAVGTVFYPDNNDLFGDVALNYALTGGLGGLAGFFRAGSKVVSKTGQVQGADLFMAPTHQLKMILDEGAKVNNVPAEELVPKLRQQVFTETPGKTGVSKKELPYVLPLEGMNADERDALNSLFQPGRTKGEAPEGVEPPLVGMVKQRLDEGSGPNQLKAGELQTVLQMLPDTLNTPDDLAKNFQYPRRITIADKDGARAFAGITSKPGWQVFSDRLSVIQERDGAFLFKYKLAEGPSKPARHNFLADPTGNPLTFYHGTATPYEGLPSASANRIPQGMVVYTTDPVVASRYAKEGSATARDAQRVFPVNITKNNIADFRNPEHLKKARQWWVDWADKYNQSFSEDKLIEGNWDMWENAEMLKHFGWKGAWITELKRGGGTELNLALLSDKKALSVFDPKNPTRIGKGAGQVAPGDQYLFGKTLNPGVLDPQAAKLAEHVTAKWAKMGAAFGPASFGDIFNISNDLAIKAMSVIDYDNLPKVPAAQWKTAAKERVGRIIQSEEGGLIDSKLGIKDSEAISNFVDQLYAVFKPTEFLQRQNPTYGRFFGLLNNAYRTGNELVSKVIKGQVRVKPGTSLYRATRGKGVEYVSAFKGHEPYAKVVFDGMTDDEANVMAHLSGTDMLNDEGLEELIGDGVLSRQGADSIKKLRAIESDFIESVIKPVFDQTGKEVVWLDNHLGLSHKPEGSLFYEIKDAETGAIKHLAFGKNGGQAQREARAVVAEAADAGHTWVIDKAKPRHLAAEGEEALATLGRELSNNVTANPGDGQIIYRAMKRLGTIKSVNLEPRIAGSIGALKERTGVSTSFGRRTYTKAEVVSNAEGHFKQLAHFAAVQSFKERFGSVAAHMLEKQGQQHLYGDLVRKANQMLGFEGQITNTLNRVLQPVFGSTLGSKPATKIASAVNHYIAGATIFWLNPAFAVLNLMTPLQTVAPWIAHMRIASQADLAKTTFMELHPSLDSNGLPNGIAAFADPLRILFGAVKLLREPTAELRALYEQADTDGLFHPQLFEEWLGRHARAQQTLSGAFKEDGIGGFLKQMATWGADQSEKFSRLTAFNAAYITGKEYFGLEGDALYRFARRGVEMTQYNYGTIDRSRIFTGPVGSMFGLFKNWQMHFIGNMLGYAGLIKNDAANPAAWAPLLWTTASATALGGLGATPLVHLADGIANWHDDNQNSFLWTQQHFGPQVGSAIYYGLPAFLGVSLQSSASIPGTDVRNETASLFSFAMWQRAKQLYQGVGEGLNTTLTTGQNGFMDPQTRDKIFNAAMPRFLAKINTAVEGDYVKSSVTGSPTARGISPAGKMLTAAGFNSLEVARWQTAANKMYDSQQEHESLVAGLGRAYADAVQNGDGEEAQRVLQRAIITGTLPSVMRSAATRTTRAETGDVLSRYRSDQQGLYRSVLAPQDGGGQM